MQPTSLRAVVERSASDPDWEFHLREFLDRFYLLDGEPDRQAEMIRDDPGVVGEERADAFLGGVGEHLARRWTLPIPGWVRHSARYLRLGMFVPDERRLRRALFLQSPVSFRSRLIFVAAEPLQRARFPYARGTVGPPWDNGRPSLPRRAPGRPDLQPALLTSPEPQTGDTT